MDSSDVVIIGGTGDQGFGLALRWAQAGRRVTIGSRVHSRAVAAAQRVRSRLGDSAQVVGQENHEAVGCAPLVVLSVPYEAQIETLAALRDRLQPGQILVDCSVPLQTAVGGSPSRLLGVWHGSAAEQAAQHVPEGIPVVAAFHNIGAHALQHLEEAVECDVIVCGDSADARRALRPWVEAIPNCRYIDGGPLENARIVEALTALLVGINRRYKVRAAGIRLTGLSP